MTHVVLVAAARPNFVKIAPIWRAIQARGGDLRATLVHTGQHYDKNMSDVFFADLGLPEPHEHLGVGSGTHAEQTAGVMTEFEKVLRVHSPDCVLVVGDVNATMACTITAVKLDVPVIHVEAGLRSRDRTMPEEINRILTDSIADLLLTPSRDGNENLIAEGVDPARIECVGNVMIDSLVHAIERVRQANVAGEMELEAGQYGLVTLHRPANVDHPDDLRKILDRLRSLESPMVFPVHPRTRGVLERAGIEIPKDPEGLRLVEPLGYDAFLNLMMDAGYVITDSGGIQEETTYLRIPCLTLRPNTERPITVTDGTNELVSVDTLADKVRAIRSGDWKKGRIPDLWDGHTAERIAEILARRFG